MSEQNGRSSIQKESARESTVDYEKMLRSISDYKSIKN